MASNLLDPSGAPSSNTAAAKLAVDARAMIDSLRAAMTGATPNEEPYRHWLLSDLFPTQILSDLKSLPFPVPDLGGESGTREMHNATRQYFDAENVAKHDVCRLVADAFQAPETVAMLQAATGCQIEGCYLRLEYCQDTGPFWLGPHTDLGVKKLTMLCYLPDDPAQSDLGTDVYRDAATWAKRPAFDDNTALVFVPSDKTWHGFEPREIHGVRKSIIMNYVTNEWRAREQLSFPQAPVTSAR